MANTLTIARPANQCQLWTPWGPQSTSVRDQKLASLRRTLKSLGKKPKGRAHKHADEGLLAPPDIF